VVLSIDPARIRGKAGEAVSGSVRMSHVARRMQAVWNGVVVAESDDTVVVEGNHYFPRESLREEFFVTSTHSSVCPWKGQASYYSVVVDGSVNPDAAWFYPSPLPAARQVTDRVAFWRGVTVCAAPDAAEAA
jgi:uncharacterized protein (DUF427 family)